MKTSYGYFFEDEFTQTDMSVQLPANYVEDMRTVVRNKVNYCQSVLANDYFGYVLRYIR